MTNPRVDRPAASQRGRRSRPLGPGFLIRTRTFRAANAVPATTTRAPVVTSIVRCQPAVHLMKPPLRHWEYMLLAITCEYVI